MAYDARRAATGAGAQASGSFEDVLRLVVDEATYPRLHRMAWSSDARQAPDEWADFLNGVDCTLDGIQAQVGRDTATKQRPSQPSHWRRAQFAKINALVLRADGPQQMGQFLV